MENIINVSNLTHFYGAHQALDQLSFDVARGEVFALLGPNGAGKTTTVRLLNGMFEPSSGAISVLGIDPIQQGPQVREQAGVLTETPALYERLTARQNLRFFGVLAGLRDDEIATRSAELLDLFGLSHRADDRTGTFSKGMKQRLALARAWFTHPKLLFLDEPTSGLDPEAAVQVREYIADVREKEGTTVVICTHNLAEAQRLCDRLLIMKAGTSLAQGSLEELRKLVSAGLWVDFDFLDVIDIPLADVARMNGVLNIQQNGAASLSVEVQETAVIPQVIASLAGYHAQIIKVQPREISLEDIYLKLQNNNGGLNELA